MIWNHEMPQSEHLGYLCSVLTRMERLLIFITIRMRSRLASGVVHGRQILTKFKGEKLYNLYKSAILYGSVGN